MQSRPTFGSLPAPSWAPSQACSTLAPFDHLFDEVHGWCTLIVTGPEQYGSPRVESAKHNLQLEQLSNSNILINPWNGWQVHLESRWQWMNGTCLKPPTKQGCVKQYAKAGPRHSCWPFVPDPLGEVRRDRSAWPRLLHHSESHHCHHRLELQQRRVLSFWSSSLALAFLVGLMLPNFKTNRKVSS